MNIGMTSVVVIFSVFCAVMLIVGIAAGIYGKMRRQRKENLDDFVLGGRTLGNIAGFFTTTATMFSAYTYFAVTGVFYSEGIGAWYLGPASVMLCTVFMYVFGVPLWTLSKKYGFLNITEYLSLRFKVSVGIISSIVMVVVLLGYIGAQLRGLGIVINSLSGGEVPLWVGAVLLGAITALYVAFSGFRGVVWTDVIQGVLMYVMLIVATLFLVYKVSDGFVDLTRITAANDPALLSLPGQHNTYTFPLLFSSFFMLNVANYMLPQMQQRYLAYKSLKTLKINALALPVGLIVVTICSFYIGLAGKVHFPAYGDPESVYPALIVQLFPRFLGFLAIFAILAAVGSTANGVILTLSSMVSREWLNPLIDRMGGSRLRRVREATVTRIALPFVVGGGLLIAFFGPPTIVSLLIDVVFAGVAIVFPAVVGGLFWRRSSSSGAFWSVIAGAITVAAFSADWVHLGDWDGGFVGMLVATVVLIVFSALRPDASDFEANAESKGPSRYELTWWSVRASNRGSVAPELNDQ